MTAFKVGKVVVLSIWAEDVATTAHFYRDVLGLEMRADHGTHPTFIVNDANLVVLKGSPHPADDTIPAEWPIFALEVDDLDRLVEQLTSNGVSIPRGVEHHGQNRWVMFHDPAGNLIEFVQHHPN